MSRAVIVSTARTPLTKSWKGAFNMTRAVSRGMMKRRDGVILNVTSVVDMADGAKKAVAAAKA